MRNVDAVLDLAYPLPYVVRYSFMFDHFDLRALHLEPACLDQPDMFPNPGQRSFLILPIPGAPIVEEDSLTAIAEVPLGCHLENGDIVHINQIGITAPDTLRDEALMRADHFCEPYIYAAGKLVSQRCLDCPVLCPLNTQK